MSEQESEGVEHQAPWVFFVTVGASLGVCALILVMKAVAAG
jgi:hypothetical protein